MDAARTSIAVERTTEPFSGMPVLRVTGFRQGPIAQTMPTRVEVHYDSRVATRCELIAVADCKIPPGHERFNFGTQIPIENGIREVVVVLTDGLNSEEIYRREWHCVGVEVPLKQPSLVQRILRSFISGQVLSPGRWKARLSRLAEKLLELNLRVRYRLLARRFRPRALHTAYAENTTITPRLRQAMAAAAEQFRFKPTFSILTPVYNVEPHWLREAIESVRRQIYPHWELCLADDRSTDPALIQYLADLPADPRIKLVRRDKNGHICRATNSAADLATGEFVCLLDHDDTLAPHALFAMAERLQDHPDADLLYSDEDKIDSAGHRYDPQFKPDWSPELLVSYNYVNHFTVIRRSLFEKTGRFRPGFEGSQDHDLLLRLTELTDRVQHVPQVLYHWRSLPSSTAAAAAVKSYVHTAGRKAVAEALVRRGTNATPYVPPFAQKLGLPVLALDGPDCGPSTAIAVVGEPALALRTIAAIQQRTAYRDYTTHGVAGGAEALNRWAASRAEDLVLFLEAGATPTDSRWLSRLVANLNLIGVGAVGGKLLDADGTVIEAGLVMGQRDGTAAAPAFAGLGPDSISYFFYGEVTRNVSAVSGRCLLTRRDTFERLGGFDSRRFPRNLSAVDYCLRLRGLGLHIACVAGAELTLLSNDVKVEMPSELLALKRAHGRPADAYHNPNCSEATAWRPICDSPLSLAAEARHPPVRALVAAHNLNNPEGAPRYLSEIILGLKDRGVLSPAIFSPLGGPGASAYTKVGVPVDVRETAFSLRYVDGLWSPREYEAAQLASAKVLREHQPEVVIANTLTTFPLVEAAARAGIPSVLIIHESYSADHLQRLFPPFARKRAMQAFTLASRVIPASHDTAKLYEQLNTRGNFRVIHNGLDPKPFDDYLRRNPRPEAVRKHFIAVGTICERKGQHTLVEAAALLARERRDFTCSLVGLRSGIPYADYVRHLIARHRLESVVNLVPETDNVWSYYRSADAFICTSHMETFSRAILEAEAFGLPIVSTPVSGVGEQVYWNANALRFEFGDAAALADQLSRLLADDALREEMGRQSRAAFDNHLNQDEMLDRYESVILAVARQGPRARMSFISALAPNSRRAA
jgi:glycosyltransferase involved in cell wall biosynthesis/GT2 family glycosyltransferase